MNVRGDRGRIRVIMALFALAWAMAVGVSAAGRPPSGSGAIPAHPTIAKKGAAPLFPSAPPERALFREAPQASGFVGDDTCTACHEAEGKVFKGTLHGKAQNVRTPSAKTNQACETCHGPGQEHAESGDKTKIRRLNAMAPRDASETCLACHTRGTHVNWKGSMHDARNLSCVTCHSIHSPKSAKAQLKTATVIETCATCHKTEVAKLQRAGHMPLREGKMDCVSCHNPHGSTNVRMLKVGNWINETCVSCHTEKRGPFLWDHAPVREACNTCHDPHGSNNDRMLVAKLPMLCQRCHIGTRHPSTIYDGAQLTARSNRLIGRGCVNCHAQIHGSNSPAGNTFLR
jgi:DmsE family decaheme c-type cytochrome